MRALRHTGISLIYQDQSLRVVWAQNVPPRVERPRPRRADRCRLPAGRRSRPRARREAGGAEVGRAAEPGDQRRQRQRRALVRDIGRRRQIRRRQASTGVITTAIDVTDRKRREQTLRALLREVSHRSKNLLAIIQSIATQTGRYSGSIDGFLSRFRGRLQSLASSQDLVTSSNWRGADLRELVVGPGRPLCRRSGPPSQHRGRESLPQPECRAAYRPRPARARRQLGKLRRTFAA